MYLGVMCQKSDIEEYFSDATEIVQTRGQADGFIVKYPIFYLKVYPEPKKESTYIIQEFRYNVGTPYRETVVPRMDLRRFASRFQHG